MGTWTTPFWPPQQKPTAQRKKVTVYPKAKKPKQSSKAVGVWTYPEGTKAEDDDDWKPKDVYVYPPGQKPDLLDSESHGIWGYAPGAKPKDNGEFDPKDIRVLPPGATPPDTDEWQYQGIWSSIPGGGAWPPEREDSDKSRDVGKLPDHFFSAAPMVVPTYPEVRLPKSKLKPRGVWTYPPGTDKIDDSMWTQQDVLVYPPGQKPDKLGKTGPHGLWAYAVGAKPKRDGKFNPKDIRVYPPGSSPPDDDEWRAEGIWTYPRGYAPEWPPRVAFVKVEGPTFTPEYEIPVATRPPPPRLGDWVNPFEYTPSSSKK
jgi:hypothetical protein